MSFTVKQERTYWIDVAKGILIVLVVWGHLDYFASTYAGTSIFSYKAYTNFAFLPYYMPAFFILSGICSNFDSPIRSFVVRNFKSLIIPSILLGVFASRWFRLFCEEGLRWDNCLMLDDWKLIYKAGGWFLPALFLSKCIYYTLYRSKIKEIVKVLFTILFMVVGVVLYNRQYINIWYYQHAFIALPFVLFGAKLRKKPIVSKSRLVFGLGIISLIYTYFYDYPFFNACPHITWQSSILFLILSLCGSLLIFTISMKISRCRLLEYIGQHTLTIYLLHACIMIPLIKVSSITLLATGGGKFLMINILLGLIIVTTSIVLCLLIDEFINRHLAFLKGRF